MRVLLHSGEKEYTGDTLVSSAIFHAALLYKLQYQLSAVRHVRYHVPSMSGADTAQNPKEYDSVSLQSAKGIGKSVKHQRSLADNSSLVRLALTKALSHIVEIFAGAYPRVNRR